MTDFLVGLGVGASAGAIVTLVVLLLAQDAKRVRDMKAEDEVREKAERERLERDERRRIQDAVIATLTPDERTDILLGRRTLDDVVRARAVASAAAAERRNPGEGA